MFIPFAASHGNFSETKKLIDSGISCDRLTDEQLEEIGDYYMEQMHPGQSHELMHQMMGGEDSELTKQMHINMARSIYCNESNTKNTMMPASMCTMEESIQGMKIINKWNTNYIIWSGLYLILMIGLIILVYSFIIKLLKDMKKK